jgi:hypothetical protein
MRAVEAVLMNCGLRDGHDEGKRLFRDPANAPKSGKDF